MTNLIFVALGGALGASLRFFSSYIFKLLYSNFIFSTLFVNVTGSFLIGFLMSYLEISGTSKNFIKYFLIIGFLGSFTTFSTFSFEIIDLFNNKKFFLPLIYIFLSLLSCILSVFLGYNINKL